MAERFHVFISYSREFDLQAAINLQSQLEKAGLKVFRDEGGIHEGDRWLEKLQQAVANCDSFVLLAGKAGVQRWIAAETEVALIRHFNEQDVDKRLPIFPVLVGNSPVEQLPTFLRLIQATQWDGEGLIPQNLIDLIQKKSLPDHKKIEFKGCPFVGLDAYRKDQSQLFFGRQQETLKALGLFDTKSPGKTVRWLEISGNSGSGKSSLMNAGLLPLIEQGWLYARTGITHWKVLGPYMPGEHPLSNLAGLLAREFTTETRSEEKADIRKRLEADEMGLADWLSSRKQNDSAFLLAIDQFEELFSLAEKSEREQFDRILSFALKDEDCPLFLLSTVRADFLDRFDRDLPQLLTQKNECGDGWTLPLIGKQGLVEIIDGPSLLAGIDASEVKAAILTEAKNETGALPLVENALEWLWNRLVENKLSGQAFTDHGGLAGILSQNADLLIRSFGDKKQQQFVLAFLFNLVNADPESRQHTRKRLALDDAIMMAGGGKQGWQLIDRLAGIQLNNGVNRQGSLRLITIDDGWVNLIHETLIRKKQDEKDKDVGYWPMFWKYIEQEKHKAPLRERLKEDARAWSRQGFWGRRLYAPNWLSSRKLRGLAVLPVEKKYLRAGAVNSSLLGMLSLLLIVAAIPASYRELATLWVNTIPERVMLRFNGVKSPDMEKDMVLIQPDPSIIQSIAAKTGKTLNVMKPYTMSKYEVTFAQYDDFVVDTFRLRDGKLAFPYDARWGRKNRPVLDVDWNDAIAYSIWLGGQTGRDCTLPTEDEWEYAARAGSTKHFAIPVDSNGSDDIRGLGLANCKGCEKDGSEPVHGSTPVGHFPANQWGLHDMHGNVWEWCLNREGNDTRVLRGGSWDYGPDVARASSRSWFDPVFRDHSLGFRVVCSSPI